MYKSTRFGAAARGRRAAVFGMSLIATMLLIGSSPMIDAALATPASPAATKAKAATPAKKAPVHRVPFRRGPHITPFGKVPHLAKPATPFPPHLDYYGGRVVSDIKVYEVIYGAGTYMTEVNPGTQIEQFYGGVTNSPYMDWLTQYNTIGLNGLADGLPGSGQRIGRGTFVQRIGITPSAGNNGSVILGAQVDNEITNQILSGALPFPDANTYFSVHFRAGQTICTDASQSVCSMTGGGFCAYHTTSLVNGVEFYYAVMPDFSTQTPDVGCGPSSPFNNMTSTASHELIETMTDAEVGFAGSFNRPLAWYDANNMMEIGDICNQIQSTVVGGDGNTYTVQQEWSNADNGCVVQHNVDRGQYNATTTYLGQTQNFYYDTTSGPGSLRHAWSIGGRWFYETLDGSQSGSTANGRTTDNVGSHVSVTIWAAQPHVFYYDASVGSLRHAWFDGAQWWFETLDGPGSRYGGRPGVTTHNVGQFSSVTLIGGLPHAFYYDADAHALRHNWWDGAQWWFEVLDGTGSFYVGGHGATSDSVGQSTSLALYGGDPQVWYYDETAGSLRHGWYSSIFGWNFETLDGTGSRYSGHGATTDTVGKFTSVTLYQGQPHVWYYDLAVGSLRHGWWTGSTWAFETLDGTGSTYPGATTLNVGQYAAAMLYLGRPHVWYYQQATRGSLRHGWWTGSRWAFETLDGPGTAYPSAPDVNTTDSLGKYNSVMIVDGEPMVWYRDDGAKLPRHAWFDGAQWNFEMLDT